MVRRRRCVERRVKFEERVSRGAVISPVQRLEYLLGRSQASRKHGESEKRMGRRESAHGDDVGVAHDGVGERERKHDLELQRRDVPVHCDLLERV